MSEKDLQFILTRNGIDAHTRKIIEKDSKRIWEIRNHPTNRVFFNSSEKIQYREHWKWFNDQYFVKKNNYCFVLVLDNDTVIGYCRFDYDNQEDSYFVSIALDPNYHNQGLGSVFLKDILNKFVIDKEVIAEIKKINQASIKVFQQNNFKIWKELEDTMHYKYKPVINLK